MTARSDKAAYRRQQGPSAHLAFIVCLGSGGEMERIASTVTAVRCAVLKPDANPSAAESSSAFVV